MTILGEKWPACRYAHKENITSAAKTCRSVLPPFRTRHFKPSRPQWLKHEGKAVRLPQCSRYWSRQDKYCRRISVRLDNQGRQVPYKGMRFSRHAGTSLHAQQFKPSRPEWLKQAGKAVEYWVWASLGPFIEPLSYSWAAVGNEC